MTMGGGTPGEGGSVVAIGLLSERPSTESPVPGSLRWFDGPTGQELGHHAMDMTLGEVWLDRRKGKTVATRSFDGGKDRDKKCRPPP